MTSYRLASAVTLANANNASATLTFTLLFTVSSSVRLTGIWWYSPSGAASLPDSCCLFETDTDGQVTGTLKSSATWSGAAGSGWVKCTYDGSIGLDPSKTYIAAVHTLSGVDPYGKTTGFWTTGAGESGLSSGPLAAPNFAANSLQGAVQSGGSSISYPTNGESGAYFGVDVEVTPAGAPHLSGLVLASVI